MFLNKYAFMPHYNTSKFLNAPLILNFPDHFFEIKMLETLIFPYIWGKSLFAQVTKNINISEKSLLFKDHFEKKHCFCPYVRKYQRFDKNYVFIRSFWERVFYPYLCKFWHYVKRDAFGIILKKWFLSISSKISIFDENYSYLDFFKKTVFC